MTQISGSMEAPPGSIPHPTPSSKTMIKNLRDLEDGLSDLVRDLDCSFSTSAQTILGYLVIDGLKAQITLKAETDQSEWEAD